MLFYIINPVIIINYISLFELIKFTKTVFRNKDWKLISACYSSHSYSKPCRIYFPVPVGSFQIFISLCFICSGNSFLLCSSFFSRSIKSSNSHAVKRIFFKCSCSVIVNTHKIRFSFFQKLCISLKNCRCPSFFFEKFHSGYRIFTPYINIHPPVCV